MEEQFAGIRQFHLLNTLPILAEGAEGLLEAMVEVAHEPTLGAHLREAQMKFREPRVKRGREKEKEVE